jgi:hypothetical protein
MFACIGAGISFYGVLQYVRAILGQGTKPRMASWMAWLTANSVFMYIAMSEGAYLAAAINGAGVLGNVLVIVASQKKKVPMRPADLTDWSCLAVSLLCIVLMAVMVEHKTAGALLAITANLVATAPTFRHAWRRPREEAWQLFAANATANGLGVAGIIIATGEEFTTMAGPLISTLGNLALVGITAGRGLLVAVENEVVHDVELIEEELAPERFAD